jgi:hypothetical protein
MWRLAEIYHAVTYFTPQSRAATDALGCKGGWMGYFGMRAAPLGAASPELVTAVFYNFHPSRVARALPDAWRIASPERFLATRLAGVDAALRAMLGDDALAGPEVAEAAGLAGVAADNAPTAGRPLGAANAALPVPGEPHLALWQATTVLRESRGDGHVAALVSAGLDPCQTLVLYAAEHAIPAEQMRQWRGWPEPEWARAVDRLTGRGLLRGETLTDAGRDVRAWVEERTDAAANAPWAALGTDRTDRLAALLRPLADRLTERNDAFRDNPMALRLQPDRG